MLEKSYFPVINLPSQLSDSNVTVLDHIWQIHKAIKLNQELFYTPSLITYLFFFCANMSKSFSCQETKRLFNQQNINKFNQILEKIDITPIFNEHNPNYAIESLIGTNSQGCTQPQKKGLT